MIHGSSDQLLKNTVIQDHTNKLLWCWCTEFRSYENATNRKNLTFDHDYLSVPTRFLQFFSWTCFRLWILSCKVGFSMGSCWRIKLWGLENCMRALFINGSGQCNVLHQWSRYQFSFFTSVMYLTRGFKIYFPLVGMSLVHIFILTGNVLIILVGFLPEISIFFLQPNWKCQKPNSLAIVCWYDPVSLYFFTSWSKDPWITTWHAFSGRDS